PLLRECLPAGVQLVDTGEAVARQLQARLNESGRQASDGTGDVGFWSSGDP
ncbi:MAG TPA: glutamate racemase, partial [Pseudomonas sp.]|nr:glutamate racemase [Pseudomonas sp.]